MKWNKVLQGTLVVAAATATWVGAGAVTASAAGTVVGNTTLEMDPANQTLQVSAEGAKEVLFAVGTPRSGKMTVSAWDVYDYESEGVSIDLSKLSNVRDNYILVSTDVAEELAIIKIPAGDKVSKAIFNAATSQVAFGTGKNTKEAQTNAKTDATFEYRTAFSSWGEAVSDWSKFQQQGAVLYLRTPAVTKDSAKNKIVESTEKIKVNGDTEDTVVYTAPSLPGKEAKLTIPKRANGPKVSVNYVAGTVSIPKNTEWRVVNADTDDMKVTIKSSTTKAESKEVSSFFTAEKEGAESVGILEVRTVVNETAKKAYSKWTRVEIEKSCVLSDLFTLSVGTEKKLTEDEKKNLDDNKAGTYTWGDGGVKESKLLKDEESNTSMITAAYKKTGKGKNEKYTHVVLTNASDYAYQIVVQNAKDGVPAQNAKVTATLKAGTGKTASVKATNGQHIYVRLAGNKTTKSWVGLYEDFGVVDYPQSTVIESTGSDTEEE